MLFNDLFDLFRLDKVIGDASLIRSYDVNQDVVGAQSATTGLDNITTLADHGAKTLFRKMLYESRLNLFGAHRYPAGALADQNFYTCVFAHD